MVDAHPARVPQRTSRCYNCGVARVPAAHAGGPVSRQAAADVAWHAPGEVELWWTTAHEVGDPTGAIDVLDDAERSRARRFRFERDRTSFVRRHAFVRRVLASYLHVAPGEVAIRALPGHRPELDPSSGVCFSTSASGDAIVVAVAHGRRVGVDIERLRDVDDPVGVACALFTEGEIAAIRSLPPDARSLAFLDTWTRKESYVKAIGEGLRVPLDQFDVSERDEDGCGRPMAPAQALPFVIARLGAPPGYVGSVALAGSSIAIRTMTPDVDA